MKEYKKPVITTATFETVNIITTSVNTLQFTQSGDITGQTTEWKSLWNENN